MKSFLKKMIGALPISWREEIMSSLRSARGLVVSLWAAVYDWYRFVSHSGLLRASKQGTLEANIVKTYHRLEKGLAVASPRPGFGRDAVELLIHEVRKHQSLFGPSRITIAAVNTLEEYIRFNADVGGAVPEFAGLVPELKAANSAIPQHGEGGTIELYKKNIHANGKSDMSGFFYSRHSIRQFSDSPVPLSVISEAVRLAQSTPSVCNRQSGNVYVVSNKADIKKLLAFQNGNRGFGENIDKLLLITSRTDTFLNVGERYQHWIDGGMFAMTLIWALHSLGVGTCCLNLSIEPSPEMALRKASGIPDDQAMIMMLAVGDIPDRLLVAQSPRRALDEVLHTIALQQNALDFPRYGGQIRASF